MTTCNVSIDFDGVGLDYGGRAVLSDIRLTVEPGEFVCVIGASGCGKTSMLRLIAGLAKPTRGRVSVGQRAVEGPRRDVAVLFQDYGRALLPWRTVFGNVSLALESIGMPKARRAAQIESLLQLVNLDQHADKYPAQLSGGMQQRLQIARTLAQEPSILLMDEPFGALDAMTRQSLQDEILRIVAERRVTVFFVTHDLEEALYLGDRVVALYSGPGRIAELIDVPLPRPRNQLTTREQPDFAPLRRKLFTLMEDLHR
ncbi:MAG: ABC transporter ATP-binding protein [Lautropia sp.]